MDVRNREVILASAVRHLEAGHVLLYPTDTVWGLGCDAFSPSAIGAIYRLKGRPSEKGIILLVDSVDMLTRYIGPVPDVLLPEIDDPEQPTTVIYDGAGLPEHACAPDGTAAIRIVQHAVIRDLIYRFGHPITSTSANPSGMPPAKTLAEVDSGIREGADFFLPQEFDTAGDRPPSRIIRLNDNGEIIRLR